MVFVCFLLWFVDLRFTLHGKALLLQMQLPSCPHRCVGVKFCAVNSPVPPALLLHIDADWYASVKIVLENLYDKVVEGGFVVLDDYWRWPGCREAVTDYLKEHQVQGVALKQVG